MLLSECDEQLVSMQVRKGSEPVLQPEPSAKPPVQEPLSTTDSAVIHGENDSTRPWRMKTFSRRSNEQILGWSIKASVPTAQLTLKNLPKDCRLRGMHVRYADPDPDSDSASKPGLPFSEDVHQN